MMYILGYNVEFPVKSCLLIRPVVFAVEVLLHCTRRYWQDLPQDSLATTVPPYLLGLAERREMVTSYFSRFLLLRCQKHSVVIM